VWFEGGLKVGASKKLLGLIVMGAAIIGMSSVAMAGKGGGGAPEASSIALAQSPTAFAAVQPTFGSYVSFTTTYPKSVRIPRIEVLCYQNGSLVYGEGGGVTDQFLLGGSMSLWLQAGGGAADCVANLFYFGSKAGQQTYEWLASTSFSSV
jgi:hypothetical protein